MPSKEVLLHLINYILTQQTKDTHVDFIIKNTRVHILVSMNPDGHEIAKQGDCTGISERQNANGYDLNRNFPDFFECNDDDPIQLESLAVIRWLDRNDFILSAQLHGGVIVANYPFDNTEPSD